MSTAFQDVRHAARTLKNAPGFTAVAVLVFAIGLGASGTVFSLIDAALIRPLPFVDPDRLVMLWERAPQNPRNRVAPLNFLDWQEQNRTFVSMAAVALGSRTFTSPDARAERVAGQAVTAAFFDVLGIAPIAGRTFLPEDATPRPNVVVIGERFWRSRLGGDAGLIGRPVTLDGQPFFVIGIMPADFEILFPSDLWTLLLPNRIPEQRRSHYVQVVGRLKAGASVDAARADMSAVAENISRLWPDTNRDWGVTIAPLREAVVGGELRVTAWVLAGVMACVLLLACANIANLLLARGIDRTREMAVRAALGGSTTRIVRQLVTESVVLAGLGGLAGLGITWAALRAVPTVVPSGTLPLSIFLVLDGRVAAFCLTLMLATGVVCGLAPAWHAARVSWPNAAGASVRGSLQGTAAFRTMLAVVEIACAVVLLAGAGLLLRTLLSISQADAGYHADRVLTMRLTVPINRYPTQERLLTFYEALEREIAAVPGVRAVGLGGNLPLDGRDMSQGFEIYGQARPDRANRPTASYQIVSRGYFETLGIRVIRGRGFTDADTMTGKPVCVVNEEFARRYLAGRDPVGAVVNVAPITPTPPKEVAREVVGVIAQVKERADESEGAVQIYVPMTQNPWYSASIAVGSVADPAALSLTIAAAVSRVDEDQPVTQIRTMREVAAEATSRPRFRAELLAMSALFALVLAATGIFSLLAFSVQQRTREFGIRMAIGARAIDVVRLVLASGMRSTAAGCGIGLLAASTLTRFLQSLLHGVTPLDPLTFLSIPAIIGLTALAACAGPALSAARAHPAEALRQEY